MHLGLYQDLAVGSAAEGSDAWSFPTLVLEGVEVQVVVPALGGVLVLPQVGVDGVGPFLYPNANGKQNYP